MSIKKPDPNKLTFKEKKFCREYMKTGNKSEAYRRSFDTSNTQETSIHVLACELSKVLKVRLRLEELEERAAEMMEIDVKVLVEELNKAQEIATKEGQAGAYVSAVNSKAKMLGIGVENININSTSTIENKGDVKLNINFKKGKDDEK